jgi:hypothetical protein
VPLNPDSKTSKYNTNINQITKAGTLYTKAFARAPLQKIRVGINAKVIRTVSVQFSCADAPKTIAIRSTNKKPPFAIFV